jgi:hypothetical protein
MSQLSMFGEPPHRPLPQPPELNRLNHVQPPGSTPNLDGRDQGIDRALSAESEVMKAAALDLLRELCRQQELITTDDWHQAAFDAGLMVRPKAIGGLWQKARRLGWCVDTGQVVLTRRPRAHGRKVPVYKSCLFRASA